MLDWAINAFRDGYVAPRVDRMMRASGEAMKAEAIRRCPVDTGQLRDSIGYVYDVQTRTIKLYADKAYAAFVEFGYHARSGVIVPPQPFLRPALAVAGKVWGGADVTLQFPGLATKYHARTIKHAAHVMPRTRRFGHAPRVAVGHGRFH